jgi:hypothetical protein
MPDPRDGRHGLIHVWLFEDEQPWWERAALALKGAQERVRPKQFRWLGSPRFDLPTLLFNGALDDDGQPSETLPLPHIVILDLFRYGHPAGIHVYEQLRAAPGGDRVFVIVWSSIMSNREAERTFVGNPDPWLVLCSQKTVVELRDKLEACTRRIDEEGFA